MGVEDVCMKGWKTGSVYVRGWVGGGGEPGLCMKGWETGSMYVGGGGGRGGGQHFLTSCVLTQQQFCRCEVFQTVLGLEILLLWCVTLELRHFRALPTVPCD